METILLLQALATQPCCILILSINRWLLFYNMKRKTFTSAVAIGGKTAGAMAGHGTTITTIIWRNEARCRYMETPLSLYKQKQKEIWARQTGHSQPFTRNRK